MSPLMLLAALASSGTVHGRQASTRALLDAFRASCLAIGAPVKGVGAAALASGFHAVPLIPSAGEVHETGAWEKNGVRIFTVSAQTDPRWQLPPACAAKADLGRFNDDHGLVHQVAKLGSVGFVEGQPGPRASHWTLPWSDGRVVEIFADRADRAHVTVTLYADATQH